MSIPDTHPQTMQLIQITTFQALRRSLGLIIQAAPIELRNLIILNIIRGAAPSGVLFLDQLIDVDVNLGISSGTQLITQNFGYKPSSVKKLYVINSVRLLNIARSIALFSRFHRYRRAIPYRTWYG